MNTHDLIKNKGLLAVLLGVAVIATAGASAVYAATPGSDQTTQKPQIQGSINLQQIIQSNVKTSFVDAANTAASSVTNGKVISGSLTLVQGSIVYMFQVIDDKNMVYSVIVDAGNGSVLYTSQGHEMRFGGFGVGGYGMKGGFHHPAGQSWNKQSPSGGSTTGGTNPTSYGIGLPAGSQV